MKTPYLNFILLIFFAFNNLYAQNNFNLQASKAERFTIKSPTLPTTIGIPEVCLWEDDKTAAFSITIDDNHEEDIPFWSSMFEKHKLPFTWFVITKTSKKLCVKDWNNFKKLNKQGHSIQAHDDRNWYHQPTAKEKNMSTAAYEKQINKIKKRINKKLQTNNCLTYAYPFGEGNKSIVNQNFIATRGVVGLLNQANKIDYGNVNSVSSPHLIKDEKHYNKYLLPLLNKKDTLYGINYFRGWGSTHFHAVSSIEEQEKVNSFLEFMKNKASELWISTFPEIAKYSQEFASHSIQTVLNQSDKIQIKLTDEMSNEYFDHPLSLKIRLPDDWDTFEINQNNINTIQKTFIKDGKRYAYFKAIPDKGLITLKVLTKKKAPILTIDFDNNKIGKYDTTALNKEVPNINWSIIKNRATIVNDTKFQKVLKVNYPKGSIGPKEGGIQFEKPITAASEYYLDYYLKFSEDFDFALGGKLPGLTSGGEKYTGGIHPDNGEGWSARYMWIKDGELVVYFYHKDMKHKWGDAIKTNTFLKRNQWYRITQHLKVNSQDNFDGVMEVWIDGNKVITDKKVRFRLAPLGLIDAFYFSTFHGGNTPDWAPKTDGSIYFDNFIIQKDKPMGLND